MSSDNHSLRISLCLGKRKTVRIIGVIKGKEINFELAGNSSYRGSTAGSNNRKESARGTMGRVKRWKEASVEKGPSGISSWTIPR